MPPMTTTSLELVVVENHSAVDLRHPCPGKKPLNLENPCHLLRLVCQRRMSNLCRNLQLANLHTHTLLWTVSHRKNADSALLTVRSVTQSPEGPANSFPHAPILLATHQTEFNMDALPTRHGRPRRTRDMAEIYVCICGRAVDIGERVMGPDTAIRCAFEGCETSWVRRCLYYYLLLKLKFYLECLNFDCAPRGWRCENHAMRQRKRAYIHLHCIRSNGIS